MKKMRDDEVIKGTKGDPNAGDPCPVPGQGTRSLRPSTAKYINKIMELFNLAPFNLGLSAFLVSYYVVGLCCPPHQH